MNRPEVAIVILNYNGRDFLEQFLPSVLKTEYPNYRVIIADNASSDDSISFLKEQYIQEVEILEMTVNHGFAEGYNQALHQIDSPYYVLLNSDVEVTPTWLDEMMQKIENDPSIAAVQPKIRSFHNKDFFEYAGASGGWIDHLGYPFCRGRVFNKAELDYCQYDKSEEIFWSTGAAMLIKRELFHGIGGFDGSFFAHMEEIDLCWRINSAGYRITYIPDSKVYHVGGGTLPKENPHKTYLNFRNSLTTLYKNSYYSDLIWKLPLRFILDVIAAIKFLLTNGSLSSLAVIRANKDFYLGLHKHRKKRKQTIKRKLSKNKLSYKGLVVIDYYFRNKKTFKQLEFKNI